MFRRFIRSFEIEYRFHGFSRYAVYRSTSNIIIVSSVTDIIETYTNVQMNRLHENELKMNHSDHLSGKLLIFETSRYNFNNCQILTVLLSVVIFQFFTQGADNVFDSKELYRGLLLLLEGKYTLTYVGFKHLTCLRHFFNANITK